jgi:NADH-quinone oxidoreductase subunit N
VTAAVLPALSNQSALPAAFQASEVNYVAVMPLLIVFLTALVGVIVEAFAPRGRRHVIQVSVAVIGLVAAAVSLIWASSNLGLTMGIDDTVNNRSLFALAIDGPSLFLQGAILLMGILGVLTMAERFGGVGPDAFTPSGASTPGSPVETAATRAGALTSEVFPLTVFAIFGMMLFPTTNDLIGMFVALEVLSLPLYILTGLARRRRLLSQEASLKYFLLGAFSSAFFLFGTALLYGYAGSVYFGDLSTAISSAPLAMNGLLLPGAFLVFVGLLFKVGAVPFHAWTPDVYQGAPTPVTAFMAVATKAAALGVTIRLFDVALIGASDIWQPVLGFLAAVTIIVGNVGALGQSSLKRMLAYSSVAQAGYMLAGVVVATRLGV